MPDATISKLYNYKALKPYIGLEGRIPVKHKDVYVGVEIELEEATLDYKISSCKTTSDGSLKLNGAEFVTIPIKMRYLEVELRRIFEGQKNPLVSARCSTHVHMNVRDMTVNQVLNLVMLYTIFERSLYHISGDRWNSNFCVPLTQSYGMMSKFFKYWNNRNYWHWWKYTGLNLCPIWGGESSQIGTVEFRQLHGTTNVEEIMQWCNIITALKRAAQDIDQEELLAHIRIMNTTSGYYWLAKEVFGRYSKLLTDQDTFAEDTEWGLTFLKSVIPDKKLGFKKEKQTLSEIVEDLKDKKFVYTYDPNMWVITPTTATAENSIATSAVPYMSIEDLEF